MKNRQINLIYPFKYETKPNKTDETISKDQLFEFLPYAKSFFVKKSKNIIIKKLDTKKDFTIHFTKSKQTYIEELCIHESKIIFFQYNIAMLLIKVSIPNELSETEISLISKNLSSITSNAKVKIVDIQPSRVITKVKFSEEIQKSIFNKVHIIPVQTSQEIIVKDFRCDTVKVTNQTVMEAILNNKSKYQDALEVSLSVSEWIEEMIKPYISSFEKSNFLNLAYLNIYTLLLIDKDNDVKEQWIDSLLLRYESYHEQSMQIEHKGIQKLAYSGNINIYSNLNGTVAVAKNYEYNQQTFFDHFGKNILLIYIFVLLQKSILIDLINKADADIEDKGNKYQNQKDIILSYLKHIDFTQLSNNPVRNEIYKFFRSTHMVKDLISEIKIIIEYYSSLKDKEDDQRNSRRFQIFEITIAIIGLIPIILEFREEIFKYLSQLVGL